MRTYYTSVFIESGRLCKYCYKSLDLVISYLCKNNKHSRDSRELITGNKSMCVDAFMYKVQITVDSFIL